MLFNEMTTKIALGAVVMRVPSVTGFDQDPLAVIETGDWVKVDADRGLVEVTKAAASKALSELGRDGDPIHQAVGLLGQYPAK
jgi:hypothetical protein